MRFPCSIARKIVYLRGCPAHFNNVMCASSAHCVFIQISETAKHSGSNLLSVHIIYIYMSVSSLHKRCRWVLRRDYSNPFFFISFRKSWLEMLAMSDLS